MRLVVAGLTAIVALLALSAVPVHAQEEDLSGLVVPDSLFEEESIPGPEYLTIYDRDNTRSNWSQTLTYSRIRRGTAISISGDVSTQDLSGFENKSTVGQFMGRLSKRITRRWVVSMDGRHGMNSSTDGTRNTDSRRNRL
ncbi:MAG TPA: hypothetical protein VJW75_04170, partial [Candidatus Eisenbacteria bacterium]|nr:hypothetical protein [Candidatus Eisenbacteria bacterium]